MIDRSGRAVWLHLDDGRVVRLASMPDELVNPLHEAHNCGARIDYIEMRNGCSRVLAWWSDSRSGLFVAALPAREPTEVR